MDTILTSLDWMKKERREKREVQLVPKESEICIFHLVGSFALDLSHAYLFFPLFGSYTVFFFFSQPVYILLFNVSDHLLLYFNKSYREKFNLDRKVQLGLGALKVQISKKKKKRGKRMWIIVSKWYCFVLYQYFSISFILKCLFFKKSNVISISNKC